MGIWRSFLDLVHGLASAGQDSRIRVLLSLTLTVVLVATLFYHLVEGWRILDAAYFSVVTMATVGFGDLAPRTDLGKIFTVFLILFGIGLFVASASAFADHVVRRATGRGKAEEPDIPVEGARAFRSGPKSQATAVRHEADR